MERMRVFRFELFDRPSREFVRQAGYATEARIRSMKGIVMYSTAKDVSADEVDGKGCYSSPPRNFERSELA